MPPADSRWARALTLVAGPSARCRPFSDISCLEMFRGRLNQRLFRETTEKQTGWKRMGTNLYSLEWRLMSFIKDGASRRSSSFRLRVRIVGFDI